MAVSKRKMAEMEIRQTLSISNIFMRMNGLSFIDEPPKSLLGKLKVYSKFVVSSLLLFWMLVGEIAFTASLIVGTVSVEELIRGYVHIAGYDTMSKYSNIFFSPDLTIPDVFLLQMIKKEGHIYKVFCI